MKRFLCNICNSQLKIIVDNNSFFKYNTECGNGHKNTGISLRDMPYEVNEYNYKCQEHKRFSIMFCLTCQKEICLFCFQISHKTHSTEYLYAMNYESNFFFSNIIEKIEDIKNNFLIELEYFNKNNNNVDISSLKTLFEKEYDILNQIVGHDSKRINAIDMENIKNLFKLGLTKYEDFFTQFNSFDTYLKKYQYLRLNFPNELKELKNFIEPQIEINTKIYEIIKDDSLIPINEKYYIRRKNFMGDCFQNDRNRKEYIIQIIKDISTDQKKFKYEELFQRVINIGNLESKNIVFADNTNIEKELIFFIIEHNEINKIIIKNLNNYNLYKYNIKKNKYEQYFYIQGFIYLDINKNIIIKKKSMSEFSISIYNDSFDKEKIIFKNYGIYNYFKLNKNMFAISIKEKIVIIKIDNEDIFDEEIRIKEYHIDFLYFSEKNKILITKGKSTIYLINVNTFLPEIIEKLEIDECMEALAYQYYFFGKDSIYFKNRKIYSFYDITYLYEYKIKDSEFKNISKIEINKTKKDKIYIIYP